MKNLGEYVSAFTQRCECQCGRCCDGGARPDPEHAVDLVFFKVAIVGEPALAEFESIARSHDGVFCECDPFDGKEHGYLELGGWLGDQGLALLFMGLGALLGRFTLLTPRTVMPGLPEDIVLRMAGAGLVTVLADNSAQTKAAAR